MFTLVTPVSDLPFSLPCHTKEELSAVGFQGSL